MFREYTVYLDVPLLLNRQLCGETRDSLTATNKTFSAHIVPVLCPYRPVSSASSATRAGTHRGIGVYALESSTPSSASLSICGVLMVELPEQDIAFALC